MKLINEGNIMYIILKGDNPANWAGEKTAN